MSLTKSDMDPIVEPLTIEEMHEQASESDCREYLDAIVATFKALDLLHLRAAQAAGYGTPMWNRIDAAWAKIEAALDSLRRPTEVMCGWGECDRPAATILRMTSLCAAHAQDADEIEREADAKPEIDMEAEDAF